MSVHARGPVDRSRGGERGSQPCATCQGRCVGQAGRIGSPCLQTCDQAAGKHALHTLAWPPAQLATFTPAPRRTLGKAARPPRWQDKGSLGSCRRRDRCRHSDVPSAHTEVAAPGEQGGHQQKPLLASLPAAPFPAPPLKFTTAAFLPGGEESLTHALEEINKRAEKMGSSHPAGSMNHCCSSLPHVLFQH